MIKLPRDIWRPIGFTGSLALTFLLFSLIFPHSVTPSLATSVTAPLTDLTTISISAPNSINFDLTPTEAVTRQEISSELIVSSNNNSGYSLFINTIEETNDLTSTSLTNPMTIEPICTESCEKPLADFPANSWGYRLSSNSDAINYRPVPSNSTNPPEAYSSDTANTDYFDLYFGIAITPELFADVYQNKIIISAIAHPEALTTLKDISTMQELTSQICQDTPAYIDKDHYVTKRLIDTRDNTAYWVAKLADGNCWMTQNLAYDYTGAYTALKQKVASTPASETWNYIDVSGPLWQPTLDLDTYEAETGHIQPVKLNVPGDPTKGGEYDAHYLIGNYYTYIMARDACPTGWNLPKISSVSGSFYSLLHSYGLDTRTVNSQTGYDIIRKPLHFIRTGVVDVTVSGTQSVENGGVNGRYWSSNSNNGNVYDLYFSISENVDLTNAINPYNWAIPARCIFTGQ